MDNNLLIKYMNDRGKPSIKRVFEPGPVITISRECGCSGKLLAEKLTERINSKIKDPSKKWRWISKEILNLASHELKINHKQISRRIKTEEISFFDELVSSITDKYYVHDAKIKKVIGEVISGIAISGNAVFLGRGSDGLLKDIQRSVHIKLYAPLTWRIGMIQSHLKISTDEAKKHVIEVDRQRARYREAFSEKHSDAVSADLAFNCEKFSHEEIIELIMKALEMKSFL